MATRLHNESNGRNSESRRRSRTRRALLAASLGMLMLPSVGCTIASGLGSKLYHHDGLSEFMVNYRNQAWAAKAWHCRKHRFANHCHLSDFERGFRDGYEAVAGGGNPCVPAVCPQSYWGWQYQTPDGQARMSAWFEGYPLGVQAAEQDGIVNWSQVRTSIAVPPPAAAPMVGGPAMAPMATGVPTPIMDSLSDQVESVPTPMAIEDNGVSPNVSTAKPPVSSKPMGSQVPSPPKAATAPSAGAAKNGTAPLNDPVPALPKTAPKAVEPAPVPNADPFGFN